MNEEQLKKEQALGNKAKSAYNGFIKGFIYEETQILFEAFQVVGISEPEKLLEIKRQLMAIEALDIKINSVMTTGKLASKQLGEKNE